MISIDRTLHFAGLPIWREPLCFWEVTSFVLVSKGTTTKPREVLGVLLRQADKGRDMEVEASAASFG